MSSSTVSDSSVSAVPMAPIDPKSRSRPGSALVNTSRVTGPTLVGLRLRNTSPNIAPSAATSSAWLARANPSKNARTLSRTGWCDTAVLLP